MERTKWIERKFSFGIPEGWLPNILERLYGTGVRIKELTENINDETARLRKAEKWSIKEHIGHLTDLEDLHEGRIDDFIMRKPALRAADMSNLKTNEANHNGKPIDQLLEEFIARRNQFIYRLRTLDDQTQQFQSLHPRLQTMMRPVDMAFFTAEHDDHHLASIRALLTEND